MFVVLVLLLVPLVYLHFVNHAIQGPCLSQWQRRFRACVVQNVLDSSPGLAVTFYQNKLPRTVRFDSLDLCISPPHCLLVHRVGQNEG